MVPNHIYRAAGHKLQWLLFKGINYRAEIWLNGVRVADNRQIAGMYNEFELNVTGKVSLDSENVLAVRVTPEQAFEDVDGVELADSWHDWINSKYMGVKFADQQIGISYVPDRNGGVWKQVYLRTTNEVVVKNAYVKTDLPLPATSPAALTVYCDLKNGSASPVSGVLMGEIDRQGKPPSLSNKRWNSLPTRSARRSFLPDSVPPVADRPSGPWWPYQWGQPNLYHLEAATSRSGTPSPIPRKFTSAFARLPSIEMPIISFPRSVAEVTSISRSTELTSLFAARTTSPIFSSNMTKQREDAILRYVKDMGLNMLRWEAKISSEHILEEADRAGYSGHAGVDVLQPMGEMEPVGYRGPARCPRQPAHPNQNAAVASICLYLGQRQ